MKAAPGRVLQSRPTPSQGSSRGSGSSSNIRAGSPCRLEQVNDAILWACCARSSPLSRHRSCAPQAWKGAALALCLRSWAVLGRRGLASDGVCSAVGVTVFPLSSEVSTLGGSRCVLSCESSWCCSAFTSPAGRLSPTAFCCPCPVLHPRASPCPS